VRKVRENGQASEPIRLAENESARIDKRPGGDGAKVQRKTGDPARFVRSEQLHKLIHERQGNAVRRPSRVLPLYDRTLVAWVSLDSLEQQGGGVLSLVEMPEFDGIVFGEVDRGKWMAGSPGWCRTDKDQSKYAAETANRHELVQIAIVYDSTTIAIYRNGQPYAKYEADARHIFEKDVFVLMGKRHLDMFFPPLNRIVPVTTLVGEIEEARIYDVALRPEAIALLKPNEPSGIRPLGQWTFEDGTARDSMGYFPMGELRGNARIIDGRLILDGGNDSYLLVPPAQSRPANR
jgi:beta-fructofuranosidase